ncbi:MAG TPA: DoxX family protein [Thermoanaerobaculia bacterium]|nr:DoxX family protein [Thermoanaerobaculia bacterium]
MVDAEARPPGRWRWAGRALSGLVALFFLFSAAMKLTRPEGMDEGLAHLGLPESLILPIAILEISCVLVYLVPPTAVLGAVLLTGYVGGTILTHLRVGDPIYLQVLLGGLVWLGVTLREERLRALLPVRRV